MKRLGSIIQPITKVKSYKGSRIHINLQLVNVIVKLYSARNVEGCANGHEERTKTRFHNCVHDKEQVRIRLLSAFGLNIILFNYTEPAYNEQIDAKKTARCKRVLIVTEFFSIVNYFDGKKSTGYRRVHVVTEFVESGTQCVII